MEEIEPSLERIVIRDNRIEEGLGWPADWESVKNESAKETWTVMHNEGKIPQEKHIHEMTDGEFALLVDFSPKTQNG